MRAHGRTTRAAAPLAPTAMLWRETMKPNTMFWLVSTAALLGAAAAPAQQIASNQPAPPNDSTPAAATSGKSTGSASTLRTINIQYFRPTDKRGIDMFETPKVAGAPYTGFKLDFGGAFTQQFQALRDRNTAAPRFVDSVNVNQLMPIGTGFNNSTANLYLNAQLAPGIRVALTSYLSSRHHNETWVKDGYLLIDESPIHSDLLDGLMQFVTIRVGQFEVNYGDAHFRRSDNGNALYNPFVGNLIMDALTTEIGGEVYLRANGFMAMGSITNGESHGLVTQPSAKSPAFIGKLGYDRQVNPDLRIRLTGSAFTQKRSSNQTLYAGDRAGSRFYFVMENTNATESGNFTSGLINPGFGSKLTSFMVNPFVKYRGLELFGVAERASGRTATETSNRTWTQYDGDVVYRFLSDEKLFVGGRYNVAKGELIGLASPVKVDRSELSGGWFITGNVMLKGEYVSQWYHNFPVTDIRNGGRFNGFMMEGVVAF